MLAAEPPKITVSKETTYITKPLTEDGLPDYRRAWLERLRKRKVPASENGAVDYWQTVGLAMVDEKYRQAFCDELGMPTPPEEGVLETSAGLTVTRALSVWYLRRMGYDVDDASFDEFEQQNPAAAWESQFWPDAVDTYGLPLYYPASKVAPLREWRDRNSAKLDRVVAALDKPGWYSPPPSLCAAGESDAVLNALPSMEWRWVTESLATRARMSLEEGDLDRAIKDLTAIHRFAEFMPVETWVDLMMKHAGRELKAAPVELILSRHPDVSDEQLLRLQQLRPLKSPPSQVALTVRQGERLYATNFAIALLRNDRKAYEPFQYFWTDGEEQVKWLEQLLSLPIDGNRYLRTLNQEYDQTLEILSKGKVPEIVAELKQRQNKISSDDIPYKQSPEVLSPAERADMLWKATNQDALATVDTIVIGEARRATHDQLMHLAMALGRYRLANGEYPTSLEAVVPRYAARIPVDAYGNESFGYRKTDNGFLLYSYGLNGVDDRGSHNDMNILSGYTAAAYSDQVRELLGDEVPGPGLLEGYVPVRADDIAIRLPLIEVSLPGDGE